LYSDVVTDATRRRVVVAAAFAVDRRTDDFEDPRKDARAERTGAATGIAAAAIGRMYGVRCAFARYGVR
tara:strand:+ start:221 stop:427 length:207 start_codon:yes stop_codon:yes gene_type:complete